MVLPNFLIIGAQKSGTSWLREQLLQHPDIYIYRNEIHYFDKDYNFIKGIEWYEKHFSGAKQEKAIGEKTPDYLWANGKGVEGHLPNVHRNIYKALPTVKLIVSLRNPVERAISAINHIIRSRRISPLHDLDDLLTGNKQYLVKGHGVIDYGRYYQQLMAYLEYFDQSQILALIFEDDIVQNPSNGLQKVCKFLEVDASFKFVDFERKVNLAQTSQLSLIPIPVNE